MTAAAGGLLLTFGADLALGSGMLVGTGHMLQMIWAAKPHCWEECHMFELLLLWASATVIGVIIQASGERQMARSFGYTRALRR